MVTVDPSDVTDVLTTAILVWALFMERHAAIELKHTCQIFAIFYAS
jgi:hypothetical protein